MDEELEPLPPDPLAGPDPTPVTESAERRNVWHELFVVLALVAAPQVAFGLLSLANGDAGPRPRWYFSATSLIVGLQGAIPLLYLLRVRHGSLRAFGLVRPRLMVDLLLSAAIGLLLLAPSEAVHHWFHSRLPDIVNWGYAAGHLPISGDRRIEVPLAIVGGMAHSLAVALAVYGHFLTSLRRLGWGIVPTIIATAVLNATLQVAAGIFPMIDGFVVGVMFAIAFSVIRRLWPIVLAQGAWFAYGQIFW